MTEYRPEELMVCRIAAEVKDGGITVLGSFTPLAYAAYMLAKLTHAPNSYVIGYNAVGMSPIQLSVSGAEASAFRGSAGRWSFSELTQTVHLGGRGMVECISPAQIDGSGAFNLSAIGDYRRPAVRLPGGAGSAEVVQHYERIILYVSRHSRRILVEQVDFRTGMRLPIDAAERAQRGLTTGPVRVLTPLAVLLKDRSDAPFRVESLHPGVDLEEVERNTGFELDTNGPIGTTAAPSEEQLSLLRDRIDPTATMRFDFMDAKSRVAFLRQLLQSEWEAAVRRTSLSGQS